MFPHMSTLQIIKHDMRVTMCRREQMISWLVGRVLHLHNIPSLITSRWKIICNWPSFKAWLDYCLLLGPIFCTLGLYPTISVSLLRCHMPLLHFISSNLECQIPFEIMQVMYIYTWYLCVLHSQESGSTHISSYIETFVCKELAN